MDFRRQAAINSVGAVVSLFGQWLISVLLVRMSGYEDAGIFSLAMTVSNIFNFFANYGLRNYQVSDVAGRYTQGQYLLTRLLTAGLSTFGCVVYLLVAGGYSPVERGAVILYLLYSNVITLGDTMLGSLQLHGFLQINGYSSILRGTVCFVGFIAAYAFTGNLLLALVVMALCAAACTLLYDWRWFCKFETIKGFTREDAQAAIRLMRICFTLMLSSLLPVITTALPRRAIQKINGTEQLGYFSTIFTPTVLITTLIPAIIVALVPKMAKAWNEGDRRGFLKFVSQIYLISVGMVLLAELAALVAGRPVMRLLFGAEILDYYSLLYWAILATGLNVLTSCGNSALIAVRSNRLVAVGAAVSLAVTALLSDVLVKSNGIPGAAYVLVAGYGAQVVFQFLCIFARVWKMPNKRSFDGEADGKQ